MKGRIGRIRGGIHIPQALAGGVGVRDDGKRLGR
jgi:hypothetical protein